MERDGAEAESAEEDCDTLGLIDSAGEDDGRVADVVVQQVDKIQVLVLVRYEGVSL